ncbi:DUF2855 family protein [Blastomonas aquatica]|uniref:DUF2855 domain-containing protein n=1 Tax=Blastomonas aquatica TaxID=1510276 RepID=A0ABQ1JHB7_9SPHN|nr:DUF2855 family protein [Blastomonas aquatica]GGB66031.1 hypothetical protein GCM10010833_21500 [Blastomonas aquatica]
MTDQRWAIDIDRDQIASAQIVAAPEADLPEGAVEITLDLYAMTANNVTYAVFGKPLGLFGNDQGYWDFFADRDVPGRLPVWGFATVSASRHDGVPVGTQLYGYFPMASHAVLMPGKVGPHGFTDVTPRRTSLPVIYNQYQRIESLGDYREQDHDYWPVFRPLFLTGWLIADQLEDEADYGAQQILVASASSKTAIGLAQALGQRSSRPRIIGLTSAGNADYVEGLGLYDQVVTYDAIGSMDPGIASAMIDMAGNPQVAAAVHNHFADVLKASIVVGKSHWDSADDGTALAGPTRQMFFAPGRSEKRIGEWGPDIFRQKLEAAWLGFADLAPRLLGIEKREGAEAALAAYIQTVEGKADAKTGLVIIP